MSITEIVHFGKLNPQNSYADIEVELILWDSSLHFIELKGFIDTGATSSAVHEKVFKGKIDISIYPDVKSGGANGHYMCKRIKNVAITLPQLDKDWVTGLHHIDTTTMDNGYDIIIGDDILRFCEFMYSGKNGNYTLKYFKESVIFEKS